MKHLLLVALMFFLANYSVKGEEYYRKGNIKVMRYKDDLIVSNGLLERTWRLTNEGMVTTSLKNLNTGKEWSNCAPTVRSDWSYEGLLGNGTIAHLVSITAEEQDDEGFTDRHVEVVAEFQYPLVEAYVKYVIWIYPDVSGIRTQVFLKGNSRNIKRMLANESGQDVTIKLHNGKNNANYSAAEFGALWHASHAKDSKSVEYQVLRLDLKKKYKLGLSWWDFEGVNRKQQVRLTSVDGESEKTVIASQLLPNYKQDKAEAKEFLVDVPVDVLTDTSFRIYIDNMNQSQEKGAIVSEIWLYEVGEEVADINLTGEEIRLKQLKEHAPKGYRLVTYFDCGQKNPEEIFVTRGRVDYLPIDVSSYQRSYLGYYNDTQHRNSWETPMFRCENSTGTLAKTETNWWGSLCVVSDAEKEGVILVKESHKCVNQYGVETGAFVMSREGITNTGTSLLPEEITSDEYKWCWGSWVIPYQGGEINCQLALKRFDRKRFPVNVERDMYSLVCTWGHSKNQRDGRNAAVEREVLKEMDYVKEIGVDMLLIDDGWQISLKSKTADPDEGQGWKPALSNYPDGWRNVKEKADKLGLRLGLWGVAQQMPAQDMIWNFQKIRMQQLKLDFANFGTHDKLDNMMDSVRFFMKRVDHQSSISWDLTENAARYGYYWAREYGNLHFMNRKPFTPMNVLYVPSLSLRDFWLLSHYSNLNKYQLVIQHAKATDPLSDAHLHPETYCVATALMGIPEFMAMPRYYQPEDRKKVGELMAVYKKHQRAIFTGYVFPIGNEPNNSSWSGFQSVLEHSKEEGYLMIYRELNNKQTSHRMSLYFVKPGDILELNNLRTGKKKVLRVRNDNTIKLEMQYPADFLFLKWRKKENK